MVNRAFTNPSNRSTPNKKALILSHNAKACAKVKYESHKYHLNLNWLENLGNCNKYQRTQSNRIKYAFQTNYEGYIFRVLLIKKRHNYDMGLPPNKIESVLLCDISHDV